MVVVAWMAAIFGVAVSAVNLLRKWQHEQQEAATAATAGAENARAAAEQNSPGGLKPETEAYLRNLQARARQDQSRANAAAWICAYGAFALGSASSALVAYIVARVLIG